MMSFLSNPEYVIVIIFVLLFVALVVIHWGHNRNHKMDKVTHEKVDDNHDILIWMADTTKSINKKMDNLLQQKTGA